MRFPRPIGANCLRYLGEFLESGLQTDMLGRFETAFARELGVKHCVGLAGCTAALLALAAALDFEDGDEVIFSPISDYGTVMGFIKERCIPVFADTCRGSINLDPDSVRCCITPRTRAIVVTHMTGLPCDMDTIGEVAATHGLPVYEDVCQGIFGQYKGRFLGTLGHAAAFSFDSEKTLSSDMGGCIATNDDDLAERIRFHGQHRARVEVHGFGRIHASNSYALRMSHSAAAIALGQLETIHASVAHLDRMSRALYQMLAQISGISPMEIPSFANVCSCWMAGFTLDPEMFRCDPETFAAELRAEGILDAGLGKYYLLPESLRFLGELEDSQVYPFSVPPASTKHSYRAECCPQARSFLSRFIRWTSFCDKYSLDDCRTVEDIVRRVAERNRF